MNPYHSCDVRFYNLAAIELPAPPGLATHHKERKLP
jgi:hypothetical protein